MLKTRFSSSRFQLFSRNTKKVPIVNFEIFTYQYFTLLQNLESFKKLTTFKLNINFDFNMT